MKSLVIGLAVVVAVLAGFYGGYKVGQSNVSASTNTPSARPSGTFTRGGGAGNLGAACPSPGSSAAAAGAQAFARGRITSLTATAMTISTGSCNITVDFTTGTTVVKQVTGTTSDLSDSQTVTVTGTRQADGSVKATTIAVGAAGGPAGAPSPGG